MTKTIFFTLLFTFLCSDLYAELSVVATTTDLAAVAREIGGDRITVSSLSTPTEDVHFVDPRPDKVLLLNKADLLIVIGLGLESGWLPALKKQARNKKLSSENGFFDASTVVKKLDVAATADRAKGDIHPGGNPHFNLDPRAMMQVAFSIRNKLIALDPEGEPTYSKNHTRFVDEVSAVLKREAIRFRRLPESNRQVVAYHRSLGYLFTWLGLTEVATIEPKPGVPPNPKHVASVASAIKKTGAKAIIQESYYPRKTSDTLAKITKTNVVVISGNSRFPKQSYTEHIQQIADEVYHAISD